MTRVGRGSSTSGGHVILDVLMAGDRAVTVALDRGERGPRGLKEPLPKPDGPGIDRAFAAMSLLAPDLAMGYAPAYRDAVREAVYACFEWAHDEGLKADAPRRREMPERVKVAMESLSKAQALFVAEGAFHLGVIDYAGEAVGQGHAQERGHEGSGRRLRA